MQIAKKPKTYSSYKILCEYLQLHDNICVYLHDTGQLVDNSPEDDHVKSVDLDWDNDGENIFVVETNMGKKFNVNADKLDAYIEDGFKL